jgi:hypothetical protein
LRHIILHHHIFKNAGSTLDYALARQFPGWFMHFEDEGNTIVPDKLIEFLEQYPRAKAISSHNFGGQTFEPRLADRRILASHYAMVRRPLDRLVSVYKFFRKLEPSTDLERLANSLDARSFVRVMNEQYPHMVDNPQVLILGNNGFYARPIGEEEFTRAWTRLREFSLCAPVERYDEAMVTVEYFNSPNFAPDVLDLSYVKQNVSPALPRDDRLADLFGQELYDRLVRLNQWDERLWQCANAELDRRIGLVPNFAKRLEQFRARCAQLLQAAG